MIGPDQDGSDANFHSGGIRRRFSTAAHPRTGKPKTRPFSIRLTDDERHALLAVAGTKPVGEFVRERILNVKPDRMSSRRPRADAPVMGQLLATLGRSGLASSLADLGRAAKLGTVAITPELEAQLQVVCADIQEVKRMLVRGLGLADERQP